jgi:hypothetical protein
MPSLDSIVSVTITATTVTPSRAGFGTPLVAAFFPTSIFAERVRGYSSITGMTADGFLATDPVVRAVTAAFSQNPRPPTVKVGRRASAPTQSIKLTPDNILEGFDVTVTIVSPDGTSTVVSRVNGPAETVDTIATALQPLIDAVVDLTATDNTGSVSADADNLGELFDFRAVRGLEILDETPDPGLAADIAAIEAEDADWYGFALDSNSKAEVAVAAASIEALTKIFIATSADQEVLDDTAGNIAETLETAAFARTALLWSRAVLSYAGMAWLGKILPTDPGSATWALKTLAGITVDDLTDTEIAAIESNNANHYTSVAAVNVTRQGTTADGDFIDIQRTIDALTARIQEDIFAILVNLKKLPYTDGSVSLVKGTIRGALRAFQDTGALNPEVDPTVTAPLVATIATADRANRILPDVEFTAQLAGAIHKVNVQGTLTI